MTAYRKGKILRKEDEKNRKEEEEEWKENKTTGKKYEEERQRKQKRQETGNKVKTKRSQPFFKMELTGDRFVCLLKINYGTQLFTRAVVIRIKSYPDFSPFEIFVYSNTKMLLSK